MFCSYAEFERIKNGVRREYHTANMTALVWRALRILGRDLASARACLCIDTAHAPPVLFAEFVAGQEEEFRSRLCSLCGQVWRRGSDGVYTPYCRSASARISVEFGAAVVR